MKKIVELIIYRLFTLLNKAKSWLMSHEIWYRIKNREIFSDLFEQEKMLADQSRNEAYYSAISKYVKPGTTVLDLGTGSGILSFFAAQQSPAKVYAIDHSAIIKTAERIATYNRLENIEFIQTHSKKFTADTKVDVIIHEQLGDFLFNEDVVNNVLDLRDRVLKKGGIILPSRFEIFIEPVKIKDNRFVPFISEQKIHGIDFSCLADVHPQSRRYDRLWSRDASFIDYFLCDRERIFFCDLKTFHKEDLPRELKYSKVIKKGGRLDGFIFYFNVIFDDEISFTTGPAENRAQNWAYWIFRVKAGYFQPDETIDFKITIGHWLNIDSWQWQYAKGSGQSEGGSSPSGLS